jgi:hypothetical protein
MLTMIWKISIYKTLISEVIYLITIREVKLYNYLIIFYKIESLLKSASLIPMFLKVLKHTVISRYFVQSFLIR